MHIRVVPNDGAVGAPRLPMPVQVLLLLTFLTAAPAEGRIAPRCPLVDGIDASESAGAIVESGTGTDRRICIWRHGDDGLTLLLTDEVGEAYKAAGYGLECDGEPSVSLHILQIQDWEDIGERVWMVVDVELELAGEERAKTVASCWDDDMDECADAIVDWVGQGHSKVREPLRVEDSSETVHRLSAAAERTDTSEFPLAERVLRDMAAPRYDYSRDVRTVTFDYLRATHDPRALPWLRRIARLPSRDSEQPNATLDSYAIGGALSLLAELDADQAAVWSREHIGSHPFVQNVALRILEELSAWEATADVEELFCSPPKNLDHHVQLTLAAEYLAASPATATSTCPCISGIREAVAKEIEASSSDELDLRYEALSKAAAHLAERLECPTV